MDDIQGKSDEYWKQKLTTEQYNILRQKGTEAAGSGEYDKQSEDGMYMCVGCGQELFSSKTKFDSGSGWPSFYDKEKDSVLLENDNKLFMKRTEVLCNICKGHLGHVFNDGPKPTGKRYCINSAALKFYPKKQ